MRDVRTILSLVFAACAASACGDTAGGAGGDEDAAAIDGGDTTTAVDTTGDDSSADDADDAVAPGDADAVDRDATEADASSDADAGPAGFGSDCVSDRDCISGICIDIGDTSVCTAPCVDTCPDPEWECRLLDQGGDGLVQLCVPPSEILCRPCDRDLDCGGLNNRCIDLLDGRFCGVGCESSDDCGDGFGCEPVAGSPTLQCVPTLGICGGCVDTDNDLHGLGPSCLGEDCDDFDSNTYDGASELCDTLDNDCDGAVDEGFDLTTSEAHCGACNNACSYQNAVGICESSECRMGVCADGWFNRDGRLDNGCEYACTPSDDLVEVCNERDDDCNGNIDDGFDLATDPTHCGDCDTVCAASTRASATCISGVCEVDQCDDGWLDCDGELDTGCEVDRLDPNNCLTCGNVCNLPNAIAGCSALGCVVASCTDGFINLNGEPGDGCEYECTPTLGGVESCDGVDNDCDGAVDDDASDATSYFVDHDLDGFGNAATRIRACSQPGGYITNSTDCNDDAASIYPGATELCNGVDDNCGGGIDEGLSTDADSDGHYTIGSCLGPADDCDDTLNTVYRGAVETCDGVDNDCNGTIDPTSSSACQIYYMDSDRDTFGVGDGLCLCSAQGDFVARNALDCYDANGSARPGQSSYFTAQRGDGSFDYNCDGNTTLQFTGDAQGCSGDNLDFCGLDLSNSDGWEGGTPGCGITRNWVTGCRACFIESGCFFTCVRQTRTARTQGCF